MSKRSNSTARLKEDKRTTKEKMSTAAKRAHGKVIDHVGNTNMHVSDTFMNNPEYADDKDYPNELDQMRDEDETK
jgi:hypothetical protein